MISVDPDLRAGLEAMRGKANGRRFVAGKSVFSLDHYLDTTATTTTA